MKIYSKKSLTYLFLHKWKNDSKYTGTRLITDIQKIFDFPVYIIVIDEENYSMRIDRSIDEYSSDTPFQWRRTKYYKIVDYNFNVLFENEVI